MTPLGTYLDAADLALCRHGHALPMQQHEQHGPHAPHPRAKRMTGNSWPPATTSQNLLLPCSSSISGRLSACTFSSPWPPPAAEERSSPSALSLVSLPPGPPRPHRSRSYASISLSKAGNATGGTPHRSIGSTDCLEGHGGEMQGRASVGGTSSGGSGSGRVSNGADAVLMMQHRSSGSGRGSALSPALPCKGQPQASDPPQPPPNPKPCPPTRVRMELLHTHSSEGSPWVTPGGPRLHPHVDPEQLQQAVSAMCRSEDAGRSRAVLPMLAVCTVSCTASHDADAGPGRGLAVTGSQAVTAAACGRLTGSTGAHKAPHPAAAAGGLAEHACGLQAMQPGSPLLQHRQSQQQQQWLQATDVEAAPTGEAGVNLPRLMALRSGEYRGNVLKV